MRDQLLVGRRGVMSRCERWSVEGAGSAVDPAVGERFVDEIVDAEVRLAAGLLVGGDPHAAGGRVVLA